MDQHVTIMHNSSKATHARIGIVLHLFWPKPLITNTVDLIIVPANLCLLITCTYKAKHPPSFCNQQDSYIPAGYVCIHDKVIYTVDLHIVNGH